MCGSVLQFAIGKVRLGRGVGEVMQGAGVDFRDTSAEERAHEEFEAFEFGLEDYEAEVGFGVCVAGLIFNEFDLFRRDSVSARALSEKA